MLPGRESRLATPCLSLLEDNHVLPLRVVDRIDISARLKRETAPRPSRRNLVPALVDLRYVDTLASVHLERGLRRRHLEVDSVTMYKVNCDPHFVPASVDADFLRVVLEDEAVVDERLFSAELEALAGGDAREFCDLAGGKGSIVDDLVQVGEKLAIGARDGFLAGQVPKAGEEAY